MIAVNQVNYLVETYIANREKLADQLKLETVTMPRDLEATFNNLGFFYKKIIPLTGHPDCFFSSLTGLSGYVTLDTLSKNLVISTVTQNPRTESQEEALNGLLTELPLFEQSGSTIKTIESITEE